MGRGSLWNVGINRKLNIKPRRTLKLLVRKFYELINSYEEKSEEKKCFLVLKYKRCYAQVLEPGVRGI